MLGCLASMSVFSKPNASNTIGRRYVPYFACPAIPLAMMSFLWRTSFSSLRASRGWRCWDQRNGHTLNFRHAFTIFLGISRHLTYFIVLLEETRQVWQSWQKKKKTPKPARRNGSGMWYQTSMSMLNKKTLDLLGTKNPQKLKSDIGQKPCFLSFWTYPKPLQTIQKPKGLVITEPHQRSLLGNSPPHRSRPLRRPAKGNASPRWYGYYPWINEHPT